MFLNALIILRVGGGVNVLCQNTQYGFCQSYGPQNANCASQGRSLRARALPLTQSYADSGLTQTATLCRRQIRGFARPLLNPSAPVDRIAGRYYSGLVCRYAAAILSAMRLMTDTHTEFPACLYKRASLMSGGSLKVFGKPCVLKHS